MKLAGHWVWRESAIGLQGWAYCIGMAHMVVPFMIMTCPGMAFMIVAFIVMAYIVIWPI